VREIDTADCRLRAALVFMVGAFAMGAQTLLFRAFFSVFEGNELGLGGFFTAWLLGLTLGAFAARVPGLRSRGRDAFPLLPLLYLPAVAAQWTLTRGARELAGVAPYELFPFAKMLPSALIANAPVSLVTGFLFPVACDWMGARGLQPVSRVYLLEALGGFLGAVAVTLALAAGVADETILPVLALALSVAVALPGGGVRRRVAGAVAAALLAAALAGRLDAAWRRSNDLAAWSRLVPAEAFEGSFSTSQMRYLLGSWRGQRIVLAHESVAESAPDEARAAEIVTIHFAQTPDATRVAVVGSGALAIVQGLLRMPQVAAVTWLHPDPDYPGALLARLPRDERPDDARLDLPGRDARDVLAARPGSFDLILVTVGDPTTLADNRYGTVEFQSLAARALRPGGVFSVRVSGGENYLGEESAILGASALATLRQTFSRILLKPGDETWLLARNGADFERSPTAMAARLAAMPAWPAGGRPDLVLSLFPPDRIRFQEERYAAAARGRDEASLVNRDAHPRALLHALLLAVRQSGAGGGFAERVARHGDRAAWLIAFALAAGGLLRGVYRRRAPADRRGASAADMGWLLFTTGFAGMASSILLMFIFQSRFGSIFLHAGLASAGFMLGLFAGGEASRRVWRTARGAAALPVALGLHALLLAAVGAAGAWSRFSMAAAFLMAGFAGGCYVPVAEGRLAQAGFDGRRSGAWVEGFDNLGGALGGALTGLLLLPVLGIPRTLALLAAVLLSNAGGLIRPRAASSGAAGDRADRAARALGYAAAGAAAVFCAGAVLMRGGEPSGAESALAFARRWAPEAEWTAVRRPGPDGQAVELWTAATPANGVAYVFASDASGRGARGYGGAIRMVVAMGGDGRCLAGEVAAHRESPGYFERTEDWRRSMIGRRLSDPGALKEVDVVSGATATCAGLRDALSESGRIFRSAVEGRTDAAMRARPDPAFDARPFVLAALALGALAMRRRPSALGRRVVLLVVALVAGPVLNLSYSLVQVKALALAEWPPPGGSAAFLLAVGIPALVLLFGNVYCGWMCPFGACQELAGEWGHAMGRGSAPDKERWRYARWLKFALLFGIVSALAFRPDVAVVAADPLLSVFSRGAGAAVRAFAGTMLALSIAYPRFWCRNLCPAGAFLSLLGRVALLRRWLPEIRPARCDLGVRTRADADCLSCDRCRQPSRRPVAVGPSRRDFVFLAVVALAAASWLGLAARFEIERRATVAARASAAAGVPVDVERIRRLQREGRLSGREAMHYRRDDGRAAAP
jgi:predicted membrane-bound spermidine synthase